MSEIQDPRLANLIYNFMGQTMAELNKIDKHNVGGSSLRALKTDPKNVFKVNTDASMNMIPSAPGGLPPVVASPQPVIPQATVPAAPPPNVVNAGINLNTQIEQPIIQNKIQLKNTNNIKNEFDKIISALNNIKNLLDE